MELVYGEAADAAAGLSMLLRRFKLSLLSVLYPSVSSLNAAATYLASLLADLNAAAREIEDCLPSGGGGATRLAAQVEEFLAGPYVRARSTINTLLELWTVVAMELEPLADLQLLVRAGLAEAPSPGERTNLLFGMGGLMSPQESLSATDLAAVESLQEPLLDAARSCMAGLYPMLVENRLCMGNMIVRCNVDDDNPLEGEKELIDYVSRLRHRYHW